MGWLNKKTWISWKQNITFLRNQKILNLCLIWHVLKSYIFVVKVTFKLISTNFLREKIYVQNKHKGKKQNKVNKAKTVENIK